MRNAASQYPYQVQVQKVPVESSASRSRDLCRESQSRDRSGGQYRTDPSAATSTVVEVDVQSSSGVGRSIAWVRASGHGGRYLPEGTGDAYVQTRVPMARPEDVGARRLVTAWPWISPGRPPTVKVASCGTSCPPSPCLPERVRRPTHAAGAAGQPVDDLPPVQQAELRRPGRLTATSRHCVTAGRVIYEPQQDLCSDLH